MPEGWMRLSTPAYEMLSKDGPYLQYILVQVRPYDYQHRHTGQRLSPDLLPHEAAEIIIDNLASDPRLNQFKVLANQPEAVGGQMGFKIVFSYLDQQGVAIQSLYYGVLRKDHFFNLRYTAVKRYYFDKHLPAFEALRESLRFRQS